jgi:amino acid adenylation domain-containing protein
MNRNLSLPEKPNSLQPIDVPRCVHEVFEEQVRRTPDGVAVSFKDEHLSYAQLNTRANKLAQRLRKLGVKPESRVALYLDRSAWMAVSILAVLKAGGAYVPIDLAYPAERLGFMLKDSEPVVLITQKNLTARLPAGLPPLLCLDDEWESISSESAESPESLTTQHNAAYIIYTSGSTGKPKGVIVTHHNVVRLLRQTEHWYGFNPSDVWPLFHSYAFDVSVWELWGCLFYGGRLVVVPYLVTRSPADFYELLAREKVTVLNQTPSAFRQLIWAEEQSPVKQELHLRYVICAGEALELQSLKPWFQRHGDEKPEIVNKYGITETTVHSTYRVIRKTDLSNGMGSVIGVPIPDLRIYLVDDDLKPVRRGVPGEICVGGAGVARGYLNRPELTAKRFLPDPFSDELGAMMYRSGDLAQINANGELEYLGRMDHQVKIRGFRVELGEIESALNAHPGVRESVVLARDTSIGDKRLVAYVVPIQGEPTISELREYLLKTLPDYMVPATFVFLHKLPLTTNGKVDRRALPSPGHERPVLKSQFVAPRNDKEKALAQIWSNVLELEQVGVEDNFFELGGDSIRSIAILSKAQQAGMYLALQDIFQHPTVAQLAACARDNPPREPRPNTKPFGLVSDEDKAKLDPDVVDAYPIAKLQLGMFYCNELDAVSAMYHDVFSYRINAAFDRSKLARALEQLAERHPMLRSSFHIAGFSQPLQCVHQAVTLPLTLEDLTQRTVAEQDEQLVLWIETEKRRAFDRTKAPLVRFHVQIRDDQSFQLIISFHHACLDGWSLAAVITEICHDYSALLESRDSTLAAPRITYRDFVNLERQTTDSPVTRDFWLNKLEGAPTLKLPRWPQPMRAGGHEQRRGPEIHIEEKVLAGLKRLAQEAGVPLKTVLLAAHQRVMSFMHAQNDVVTGLICNGRPEELDGEKMVGLFLNNLPFRQKLDGGTWNELIRQTFLAEQEIIPHRRFPLAEIKKLMRGESLFETAFDFVHFHVYNQLEGCRGLDLAEGHYFEANNLTTYTTFMLDISSTRLELHIDYDPNELCLEQVRDLNQYYIRTLEAMAADASGRYDLFSPMPETELSRITQDWNATQEEYPTDKTLAELFEQCVSSNPDAIALNFGNTKLTYRQLNDRAGRIAQGLRSRGVRCEEVIGIYLERSPDMVASLLGILKAGGAYLPLDPTYPQERISFMLADSGARLVLTQRVLLDRLPSASAVAVCIEDLANCDANGSSAVPPGDPALIEQTRAADVPQRPAGERLAYLIYTSGSTGKPKGVLINQGAVINLLTSAARVTGFTRDDHLLAVTTLSFDIAGLEIFMPLITGQQLTLASREQSGDGSQLAALIETASPTFMQATPATWRLLLEAGWKGNPNLTVLCGGEALKRELADQLLTRTKGVWNFYGPTETTIWSTAWKVAAGTPISIGRPLANTQLYILDAARRPVPIGAAGELYIGGAGLARGYFNRDQLTAEKFVRGSGTDQRLYRTGDLARYQPDGTVECLGRVDHQVKVRGFRIELGEIESVLREHKGIADALVTARQDSLGENRLVGYVISRNGPPSTIDLRDFAKTKLPLFMVPAQFVVLKSFPLTPNGKIDIRGLPAPESAGTVSSKYQPPRTPDEQCLASIWQDVLGLKQIGIDDHFFELGGDSLSATRAFARTNESFGTGLTLREMLDHPTIRGIAELIVRSKNTAPSCPPLVSRRGR